jgi:hypothetical protein
MDTVSIKYRLAQEKLIQHPLYDAINNKEQLRVFMQHHVYAVWDFMSLIKALQCYLAPCNVPWTAPINSRHAHFINQLVLEEESDYALLDIEYATYASHFESYCKAMTEVGADTRHINLFIHAVSTKGVDTALRTAVIPSSARDFMTFTFDVINRKQSHLLASLLAYGRESLIPQLFNALIRNHIVTSGDTPILYAYLERHIQLDEQEHGPLTVLMAKELCENNMCKQAEAREIAEQAIDVRLSFWDGIYGALCR